MNNNKKEVLAKGLKILALSLLFVFAGPVILYSAFNNQEHPLYIAVLVLGIVCFFLAMFLIFKGIKTLGQAIFDSK
ncbi:DUF6095 family protein [Mesonia sp. K7]|uniref:DUF6095 family protein n=1 Tax=Mesonia sp. K7 TaxID=2218606 RepID=UPI000DA7F0C9|nr:DUF6095 family protein [Mesonia sp. K7]PZD79586.1 hypothetical protein DNG35_00840 [Mesonia sp. K7]